MINMAEYAKRRQAVSKAMGENSILLLPAGREIQRNGDTSYVFRQNSDFYYLTGFAEPEAVCVIAPHHPQGEYILFNRLRDPAREMWDGPRAGQAGAKQEFLADQAFPITELADKLTELMVDRDHIYYPLGFDRMFDRLVLRSLNAVRAKVRNGVQAPRVFYDSAPLLHEMRVCKSTAEIAVIQKAIDITGQAHVRALKACQPGMYEYELEAELMYTFLKHGARAAAYPSIVGSGANTCILHYINNNKKIAADDLVLIDAGCEYENYAADITRTFPASGRFSPQQRDIYELVLAAQQAAIACIKPGVSWTQPQQVIVEIMVQGLVDLGILKGNVTSLIEQEAYLPYYMHRSGHYMGLDVHDAGQYRQNKHWRDLQAGMVFTVEPGIYLSAGIKDLATKWHNIGVRIEDDVLVTTTGCDVLSKKIPKTIADIEATMAA